jgi:hypothetical protein
MMKKYGSDKGGFAGISRHNYTVLYYYLFKDFRYQKVRLFELGIGTNNTKILSNMGEKGKPGASLRGWREFFPNGLIYSADIDKDILFNDERIKTYFCDQLSPKIIYELWELNNMDFGFNIIIDDGLHEFDANICFFENSCHKLLVNGFYIVEDVLENQLEKWEDYIKNSSKLFPNLRFSILKVPNYSNCYDNNLVVIHKPKNSI